MVLRVIGDITVADAAGHAGDIRGRHGIAPGRMTVPYQLVVRRHRHTTDG